MVLKGHDLQLVAKVISLGIDACLEAFAQSTFKLHHCDCLECRVGGPRLECSISYPEMSILLRRLCELDELGDYRAGDLAETIAEVAYLREEN